MGARIDAREGRFPPFTLEGARLRGMEYELPVASAQVKSCVMLAGLTAEGGVAIRERVASRDHTERMLARAGVPVARRGDVIEVGTVDELGLDGVRVPGDPSSAAFALLAAVLVPGSEVVLRGVGVNWTRVGFLRILERMGARLEGDLEPPGTRTAEDPVSDVRATAGALKATEVGAGEVPLAIDELPLVALAGCLAEGTTVVRGAEELRLKETDRIAAVAEGLRGLGGAIEATPDGFAVEGRGSLHGGRLDARDDHRMAMLGAVAGLVSEAGVEVVGAEAAAVSYPTFAEDLGALVVR
jgi:3-phosphoshikimate 1-carboxyvinyltransferase